MDNIGNQSVIFGRYEEMDMLEPYRISKESRYKISYQIELMIEEEMNSLRKRYKHGYLAIDNMLALNFVADALVSFHDIFFKYVDQDYLLDQIFDKTKKEIYLNYQSDPTITSVLNRLCLKIDARIRLLDLHKKDVTILKVKNARIHHLLTLKDHVKAVIMDKKPNYLLLDILNKKNIFLLVTDKKLVGGRSYYIHVNQRKISLDEPEKELHSVELNGQSGQFLLGLEINNDEQIIQYKPLNPGFIMVEPEKSYLDTDGIVFQKIRESFYKKLYHTYPDTEIIVTLPKLDILKEYHQVYDDFLLDDVMYKKHFTMYMKEINAMFVSNHPKLRINLSFISDDHMFSELKREIQNVIKHKFNQKVNFGLGVDLETTLEYIEAFKKYNFVVIDTERLYEELDYEASELNLFTKDISSLNQRLKTKFKDIYITGELINDGKYFTKLVSRGFKRFVVSYLQFQSYLTIIKNYHDTRGRYSKIQQNCSNNNIS